MWAAAVPGHPLACQRSVRKGTLAPPTHNVLTQAVCARTARAVKGLF